MKKKLTIKDTPWAAEILKEGAHLLNHVGVKWWLSAGTMLGIHREGDFIAHDDPDLDVGVEEPCDHARLLHAFKTSGYELFAEGSHQIVFKKRDVLFDIYFYTPLGERMVCEIYGLGAIEKPYSLFEPLGEVKFKGTVYPAPNDVEKYLTVRYGDWKTPKTEKGPWENETPALKKY